MDSSELFRFFTELKKRLANPRIVFNTVGNEVEITHLADKLETYLITKTDLAMMHPVEIAWVMNGYQYDGVE